MMKNARENHSDHFQKPDRRVCECVTEELAAQMWDLHYGSFYANSPRIQKFSQFIYLVIDFLEKNHVKTSIKFMVLQLYSEYFFSYDSFEVS